MFGDGALSFREFAMREPHPLATIHDAVIDFLRGRDDAVLYGAQALNAYVDESRMTQDVDIMSARAADLAEELRAYLNERFHIAVRVRKVREGLGYRIFQLREPKNRHLVDLRPVPVLPPSQRVEGVLVLTPPDLIASKVISYHGRRGQPKAFTVRRDLAVLLLRFPDLKSTQGPVREHLAATDPDPGVLAAWDEIVAQPIAPEGEDAEFTDGDEEPG